MHLVHGLGNKGVTLFHWAIIGFLGQLDIVIFARLVIPKSFASTYKFQSVSAVL